MNGKDPSENGTFFRRRGTAKRRGLPPQKKGEEGGGGRGEREFPPKSEEGLEHIGWKNEVTLGIGNPLTEPPGGKKPVGGEEGRKGTQ